MKKKPKKLKDCRTRAEAIAFMHLSYARKRKYRRRMLDGLIRRNSDLEHKMVLMHAELNKLSSDGSVARLLREKLAVLRWHYKRAIKMLHARGIRMKHTIPDEILSDYGNPDKPKLGIPEMRMIH